MICLYKYILYKCSKYKFLGGTYHEEERNMYKFIW